MSPIQILTEKLGPHDARIALDALADGKWIVVGKDAIVRAQREAVAAYREDRK